MMTEVPTAELEELEALLLRVSKETTEVLPKLLAMRAWVRVRAYLGMPTNWKLISDLLREP